VRAQVGSLVSLKAPLTVLGSPRPLNEI